MSRALDENERAACMRAIGRTLAWDTTKPTDRERHNAELLVTVISQIRETWSGGPEPRMWARALSTRNPDTVLEAIKRLTETSASCPAVPTVLAVCRQIDREAVAAGRDPLPDCEQCTNTGWMPSMDETHGSMRVVTPAVPAHREWDEFTGTYVDVPAVPAVVEERPIVYSAMRPCTCQRGRIVERSDIWRNRKRIEPLAAAAQEQF